VSTVQTHRLLRVSPFKGQNNARSCVSVDGCNTMLAGSPRTITDSLQRLLNAAARVVSNTGKFDRGLTHLLHSELHWLDVPQRILHKLGVTPHIGCCQSSATSIFQQPPSRRTTTSSQHARPSGGGDVLGWGGLSGGGELSRGEMSYTPACGLTFFQLAKSELLTVSLSSWILDGVCAIEGG